MKVVKLFALGAAVVGGVYLVSKLSGEHAQAASGQAPAQALFKLGQWVVANPPGYHGRIDKIYREADGSFSYDVNVSAAMGAGGVAHQVAQGALALEDLSPGSYIQVLQAHLGKPPLAQPQRGYYMINHSTQSDAFASALAEP